MLTTWGIRRSHGALQVLQAHVRGLVVLNAPDVGGGWGRYVGCGHLTGNVARHDSPNWQQQVRIGVLIGMKVAFD